MTALRLVRPNRACDARSSSPMYASTSTIRPTRRPGVAIVADQPRPDQRRRDLEGRPAEELAQVAQLLIVGGFV